DPQAPVRAAAAWAQTRHQAEPLGNSPGLFLRRVEPYPWRAPPQWIEVEHQDQPLWLPAEGTGPWRWALIPGLAEAEPTGATEPDIER
ncbi:MAG: hypothetical protein KDK70_38320, partial [Myxococcales bacterium]|nr:hypothetical protein [Myxococcales bacterium]